MEQQRSLEFQQREAGSWLSLASTADAIYALNSHGRLTLSPQQARAAYAHLRSLGPKSAQ